MRRAHHALRMVRDLAALGRETGRWWVPLAVLVMGVVVLVALTAQAAVTPAVYTLF